MNDCDLEVFEAELRKLTPARPPAALMAKLAEARPVALGRASEAPNGFGLRQSSGAFASRDAAPERQGAAAAQDAIAPSRSKPSAVSQRSTRNPQPLWWLLLRRLAPACVVAALAAALLGWWLPAKSERQHAKAVPVATKLGPKPDEVEIDRQLVALFDTVAQLPSGEPVRFRCRQWSDKVVFRDPARGLVIERRTPRLEVVPVSLETF